MRTLALLIGCLFFCSSIEPQNTNPFDVRVQNTSSVSGLTSTDTDSARQKSGLPASSKAQRPFNPFDVGSSHVSIEKTESKTKLNGPATDLAKDDQRTKIIVLIYVLTMLVILTMAVSMQRKRFKTMLKACINSNHLRTLFRENNAWSNGQSVILYIFFILNSAFVIWLIFRRFTSLPEVNLFLVGSIILGAYLLRHLAMTLFSYIYPIGITAELHNYSIALHNMVLGILILPFILAIEFLPTESLPLITTVLVVITAIIYLLRQAKSLLLSMGIRHLNLFYFFIYLCAIEIAPLLVTYKVLMGAL